MEGVEFSRVELSSDLKSKVSLVALARLLVLVHHLDHVAFREVDFFELVYCPHKLVISYALHEHVVDEALLLLFACLLHVVQSAHYSVKELLLPIVGNLGLFQADFSRLC